ncbi:MAG: formimidoylglutamase [Chlamydiae bacterium]|nr:formimidoylglutamase [Chlamydiota bacterium]
MANWQDRYEIAKEDLWQGRKGEKDRSRIYQVVECIDFFQPKKLVNDQHAIIGFSSDEGVLRNQGNIGAHEGPDAIRKSLARLPVHFDKSIYDFGNIFCRDKNLEKSQEALSEIIHLLHKQGLKPLIFGGGHEVAYAHFLGLSKAYPKEPFGIINLDAHFDLRPLVNHQGTSGTSFLQMAKKRAQENLPFNYLAIGIQQLGNTQELFDEARKHYVEYVLANEIDKARDRIEKFLQNHQKIYLSLCLDVFASPFAPGVSAPQPLGLFPNEVRSIIEMVAKSGKSIGFDIAELNPKKDIQETTAQLAALMAATFIQNS